MLYVHGVYVDSTQYLFLSGKPSFNSSSMTPFSLPHHHTYCIMRYQTTPGFIWIIQFVICITCGLCHLIVIYRIQWKRMLLLYQLYHVLYEHGTTNVVYLQFPVVSRLQHVAIMTSAKKLPAGYWHNSLVQQTYQIIKCCDASTVRCGCRPNNQYHSWPHPVKITILPG